MSVVHGALDEVSHNAEGGARQNSGTTPPMHTQVRRESEAEPRADMRTPHGHACGRHQLCFAQFLAVCRRSQMGSMDTRRPRKGSHLGKRCALNGAEIHRVSARFYALQTTLN